MPGFGDRSAIRSTEKKPESHARQQSTSSASAKTEKTEKAEKKPAGDVKKKWAALRGKK